MRIFLGGSVVATFYIIYWVIDFPHELVDSLLFQLNDGEKGYVVSVLTWIVVAFFANGIYWILTKLARL